MYRLTLTWETDVRSILDIFYNSCLRTVKWIGMQLFCGFVEYYEVGVWLVAGVYEAAAYSITFN